MLDTPALCISCNYQLRGLTSPRCPECGREFDPNDPTTMNMGRPLSAFDRFILGLIRWPVIAVTAAATGFVLWESRLPGGRRTVPLQAIGALGVIGILWLVWPMMRVIVMKRTGWTHDQLSAGRKPRLVVGAILILAAIAIYNDWPMQAAFRISRPAMNELAANVINSPSSARADRWVGFYKAQNIQKVSDGVKFTVEENISGHYTSGFVYLPTVDPKRAPFASYHFVGGGWWSWREDG